MRVPNWQSEISLTILQVVRTIRSRWFVQKLWISTLWRHRILVGISMVLYHWKMRLLSWLRKWNLARRNRSSIFCNENCLDRKYRISKKILLQLCSLKVSMIKLVPTSATSSIKSTQNFHIYSPNLINASQLYKESSRKKYKKRKRQKSWRRERSKDSKKK